MSDTLRIRMYNVGFGDCFLLTLPDGKTILVDAGFHSQGKGAFSGNDLAAQIAADVAQDSSPPRIDVVIATHRHQDHVYAFNSNEWDGVEVGEVWMPWVEDRKNKAAQNLWKKQQKFAANLALALNGFNLDAAARDDVSFMLWNAGAEAPGSVFPAAVAGWSNAGALDCLHEGFATRDRARPRFLPEKKECPETFETPALPGVKIHVLGPPRDPELIEELDPEADGETYRALALRAAAEGGAIAEAQLAPFGDEWRVKDDEPGYRLDAGEIARLKVLARGADALAAAHKLDDMINSTSLVLVLQIGAARLLLPGDAEWGTWKLILANEDARALLRGATFFKVGHHGSHNATSKTLVEQILPKKIPAMISTQEGEGNYRNNIPLGDLLDALTAHDIRFMRSDKPKAKFTGGFSKGAGGQWIDLELPC